MPFDAGVRLWGPPLFLRHDEPLHSSGRCASRGAVDGRRLQDQRVLGRWRAGVEGEDWTNPMGWCSTRGNCYFADRLNRRVRRVDAGTGVITTVAGDGSKKFSGDGGPGARGGAGRTNGVALDPRRPALHRRRGRSSGPGGRPWHWRDHHVRGDGPGQVRGGWWGRPCGCLDLRGLRVEVGADGTVFILERQGNRLRGVDRRPE